MKALSHTIQKLWPIYKFLRTNKQINGQAKNYMPPINRYGRIKINHFTPYQTARRNQKSNNKALGKVSQTSPGFFVSPVR